MQVGPIVSTRVRIINVDPFPSGHLIIDDGSRSLGAKMEDTFGLSLAQQKRRVSGIATYGPQLAEFVDLHESDDARFFYFSKQQRAKLGLVWSFFLEVNRPHWVASSKYLLAKLYSALYSMFLLPWLSKTLIDSVVGTLRWDTALWVSMVAATAYAWDAPHTWRLITRTAPQLSSRSSRCSRYVVKHRMDFCFPKAWDVRKRLQLSLGHAPNPTPHTPHPPPQVRKRLQLSLARKFLSLSERDRESRQNVDARYRLAIMETAEKVTGNRCTPPFTPPRHPSTPA